MIDKLFVYGSLAPGEKNEKYLSQMDGVWQDATVQGRIDQEGWGKTGGYPAIILEASGDIIKGLLFTSQDLSKHWDELDEFEGEEYKRVIAKVTVEDGDIVNSYVYVLRK